MAVQGEAKSRTERRMLLSYAGAFVGVLIGGLGGPQVVGDRLGSVAAASLLGIILGGLIGFGLPSILLLRNK